MKKIPRVSLSWLGLSGLISFTLPNTSATQYVNLSFEGSAYIDYDWYVSPSVPRTIHHLEGDGSTRSIYVMQYSGDRSMNHAWITSSESNFGARSLGCRLYPYTASKRRAEVVIADRDDDSFGLAFGQIYYVGFDFKIKNSAEFLGNQTHMLQVFQAGCSGEIPLTLSIEPNRSDWKLKLTARSSDPSKDNDNNGKSDPWRKNIGGAFTVSENNWHRLVIKIEPAYLGQASSGNCAIYLNGDTMGQRNVWLGHEPNIDHFDDGQLSEKMDLRVGLYGESDNKDTKVFYDDIRFGSSMSDVE